MSLQQSKTNSHLGFTAIAFLLVLVLVSTGCERPVPTGTLSGTLASGGKVCGACKLEIVNSVTLRSVATDVTAEGNFRIEEIPLGEYQIAIHQIIDSFTTAAIPFDKRIPSKYRNPKTSGFTASIQGEEEVVVDLNMELGGKASWGR